MARGDGLREPNVSIKHGQSKTNFWCRWIARKPGLMFGIFLSLHIGAIVVTGILLLAGYNILPLVFDGLPLAMNQETMYLRRQAWQHRRDSLQLDDTSRRRRSLDPQELEFNMEKSFHKFQENNEIKLNLEESLEKQLWESDPSMAAGKLLSAALNGRKDTKDIPKFFNDELSRVIEKKDLFGKMDECCDLSTNSGLMPSSTNCWCNPHMSVSSQTQHHRTKRDTAIDHLKERRKTLTSITLIYEDPNGNVFTKENLQKIARFEYALYQAEDYKTEYCRTFKMLGALHCEPFVSILRFFDGSYTNEDDKFFDPSFTDIPGVLSKANEIESLKELLNFHLAKDAIINGTLNIATSQRTRSTVRYGYPYTDYINKTERADLKTQENIWARWARKSLKPLFLKYYEKGMMGLDFYYVSLDLYWKEAIASVTGDLMWLFASFLFIYVFMLFQTGSFWITTFGMASIISSFFAANLLYNIVIGYKFFGIFNVLALFIVLGIGADDIFIFSDTWKLYATCQFDSLEEKLSVVFKRAATAMFVTSLTTMVAFFVSSFSPLLPVSAFGTFAGLCIFINYLSVITFFPSVIVLYHKNFEKYFCCCCGQKESVYIHDSKQSSSPHSEHPRPSSQNSMATDESIEKSTTNLQNGIKSKLSSTDKINAAVVSFFKNKFYHFVTNKYARIVILILFLGFMALCLYSSLQVQMDNADLKIFDPQSLEERSATKNRYAFKATLDEPTMDLLITWGLGLQDRSKCKNLEYNTRDPCEGETRWNEDFSLTDDASQLALLNWCKKLRSGLDETLRRKLQISQISATNENDIECFIEDMDTFFKTEHLQPGYPANISLALPITLDKMRTIMTYNPHIYNPTTISSMDRPFEMAVNYWLTHRYTNDTIPDNRNKYKTYLGLREYKTTDFSAETDDKDSFSESAEDKDNSTRGGGTKIYQSKLMYTAVEITTTVPSDRITLTEAVPLQATWENWVNEEMEKMPPTLQHGFQQARLWVWINILEKLSTQSFSAFGIGLSLAFIVIFLGTQNIITGFFATLMLACVTCAVIAVIPVAGWKFGLLEALNFCLIVGLAVDYIVHLAEGYHMSSFTGRMDRIRDTLERVGISILSGAITTLGASFFMLFARILFFKQFGIFMFCTISCSMVFALFIMLAAYSIFGPEGYFASFVPLCRDRAKYREHVEKPEKDQGQENEAYQAENKSTPL